MAKLLRIFMAAVMLSPAALWAADKKRATPDDRIYDQIRMRLANDQDVKGGALDVVVKDGVVTLRGRVDTDKGKRRAEKLAHKVKGVKSVDNELQVGPVT